MVQAIFMPIFIRNRKCLDPIINKDNENLKFFQKYVFLFTTFNIIIDKTTKYGKRKFTEH